MYVYICVCVKFDNKTKAVIFDIYSKTPKPSLKETDGDWL